MGGVIVPGFFETSTSFEVDSACEHPKLDLDESYKSIDYYGARLTGQMRSIQNTSWTPALN
jgi:hypothetical protein